jgi:hypothetical protein
MFTNLEIFITNTTSTYQDIPKDCKLVGAEFDQEYPPDSIYHVKVSIYQNGRKRQNRYPNTQNRYPNTQNRYPNTQNRYPNTQNRYP